MPSIAGSTKERDHAAEKNVAEAVEEAYGAWVDGRTGNVIFQHKQLHALFTTLQANSDELLSAISSDVGSTYSSRFEEELAYTLEAILKVLAKYPSHLAKLAVEAVTHASVSAAGTKLELGGGVVVIMGSVAHPIASLFVPLAQALADGNSAVVNTPPSFSTYHATILKHLKLRLDQFAVQWTSVKPSVLNQLSPEHIFGIVHQHAGSLVLPAAAFPTRAIVLQNAAVPVIVDQSIMPYGTTWNLSTVNTPQPVIEVAKHIVQAISKPGSDKFASSFTPTYLIIHENISEPLVHTLRSLLPSSFQPEVLPLSALTDVLYGITSGSLDYLPVFKVTTLDLALDTIVGDLGRDGQGQAGVAYVFAQRDFGAYAANMLSSKTVYVNEVPSKAIACGPYQHPSDFSFSSPRHLHISKLSPHKAVRLIPYKSLKAKPYYQKPGFRIDFFGGSFMFAAGTFMACLLGATGFGLVKAAAAAWAAYRR